MPRYGRYDRGSLYFRMCRLFKGVPDMLILLYRFEPELLALGYRESDIETTFRLIQRKKLESFKAYLSTGRQFPLNSDRSWDSTDVLFPQKPTVFAGISFCAFNAAKISALVAHAKRSSVSEPKSHGPPSKTTFSL